MYAHVSRKRVYDSRVPKEKLCHTKPCLERHTKPCQREALESYFPPYKALSTEKMFTNQDLETPLRHEGPVQHLHVQASRKETNQYSQSLLLAHPPFIGLIVAEGKDIQETRSAAPPLKQPLENLPQREDEGDRKLSTPLEGSTCTQIL